jgi:pimeloyl-ACP methyl ester carboxylesterase
MAANPLGDEQFNLSGYSYGSVLMAQAAIKMLSDGDVKKVDNLVLIGSPINPNSELGKELNRLEKEGKIGKVIYKSSEGDNAVGLASKRGFVRKLSIAEIFNSGRTGNYDTGHLKFAGPKDNKKSNQERDRIANEIKEEGVE